MNCLAVASSPAADNSVLKAEIRSDTIGNAAAFIRKDAIRINIGDGRARIVARAPDWNVYVFNSVNNYGMEMPFSKWMAHHPFWTYIGNDDWLFEEPVLKVADIKKFGLDATRYKLATKLGAGRIVAKQVGTRGHLIVAHPANLDAHTVQIIRRAFSIPAAEGLPLELVTYGKAAPVKVEGLTRNLGGDSHLYIVTKISREAQPDSFFDPPKKFQVKTREVEIVFDKERSQSVENVIDMLK